jgi:hypothetical protein
MESSESFPLGACSRKVEAQSRQSDAEHAEPAHGKGHVTTPEPGLGFRPTASGPGPRSGPAARSLRVRGRPALPRTSSRVADRPRTGRAGSDVAFRTGRLCVLSAALPAQRFHLFGCMLRGARVQPKRWVRAISAWQDRLGNHRGAGILRPWGGAGQLITSPFHCPCQEGSAILYSFNVGVNLMVFGSFHRPSAKAVHARHSSGSDLPGTRPAVA